MDLASVISVSAALLLAAMVLLVSHVWTWRAFQRQQLDAVELNYRRRQFRRRMQTSASMGLLGAAMSIGYLLTLWLRSGWFALVYWTAMMVLACWVVLLAAMDIWATNRHFGRLHHDCMVEQAKLQAEIRRIQAYRGNGKGKTPTGQRQGESREG